MHKLQLFQENDLALFLYYDERNLSGKKLSLVNLNIYLPGLPQFVDERFFKKYVDQTNAFIQVCYYGSWLSGKDFNHANCNKSIEAALEIATRGNATKAFDGQRIDWQFQKLNLLAYSFSGNLVLSLPLSHPKLNCVFLLAPMAFVARKNTSELLKENQSEKFYGFNQFYYEFLKRGYKNVYRGIESNQWAKYFNGREEKSIVSLSPNDKIRVFVGTVDHTAPAEFYNKLSEYYSVTKIEGANHDIYELFDKGNLISLLNEMR